jgi:hypothetical protein
MALYQLDPEEKSFPSALVHGETWKRRQNEFYLSFCAEF